MAKVTSSKATERNFLVNVGSAYELMFDEKTLTVPSGGWVAGTVLSAADSALDTTDTTFFGIVAEDVAEGTVKARVLVRGVCSVREDGLAYAATVDATAKAAAFAKMKELLITVV